MILPVNKGLVFIPIVLGALIVWLTLWYASTLETRAIYHSAASFSESLKVYRQFYVDEVLGRLKDNPSITVTHDYKDHKDSLPIPATMTHELAQRMQQDGDVLHFAIVSRYPFANRAGRQLTALQQEAIIYFSDDVGVKRTVFSQIKVTAGVKRLHYVTPIFMGENCVGCHNTHPNSAKTDWKIGDLRGVEEVVVNFPSFDFTKQRGLLALIALLVASWGLATWLFLRMARRNQKAFEEVVASERALVQVNRALEEAKDKAEQSARAKSQFLAVMSHELRTPLNGIEGMAQLLKATPQTAEQAEYAVVIEESSLALLTVIEDILDLSRAESGKMVVSARAFSFSKMLSRVKALFQHHCDQKGLKFDIKMDQQVPSRIIGDETKIRQILVNLLGNAIKFTDCGQVMVKVSVSERRDAQAVLIEVIDTGIGVEATQHAEIFERFVQVDQSEARRFEGAGLGLSICKSLVRLLNGELGMDSALGAGSRFWFWFPLVCDREAQEGSESSGAFEEECNANAHDRACLNATQSEPGKSEVRQAPLTDIPTAERKLRILVAEDNIVNQKVISAILGKAGYSVLIAPNGQEAIALLQRAQVDLVLMDLQMPVLDGWHATEQIRASRKSYSAVPIIALTANTTQEDRDRCQAVGMNGFVSKPIRLEGLQRELERVCGKP